MNKGNCLAEDGWSCRSSVDCSSGGHCIDEVCVECNDLEKVKCVRSCMGVPQSVAGTDLEERRLYCGYCCLRCHCDNQAGWKSRVPRDFQDYVLPGRLFPVAQK